MLDRCEAVPELGGAGNGGCQRGVAVREQAEQVRCRGVVGGRASVGDRVHLGPAAGREHEHLGAAGGQSAFGEVRPARPGHRQPLEHVQPGVAPRDAHRDVAPHPAPRPKSLLW